MRTNDSGPTGKPFVRGYGVRRQRDQAPRPTVRPNATHLIPQNKFKAKIPRLGSLATVFQGDALAVRFLSVLRDIDQATIQRRRDRRHAEGEAEAESKWIELWIESLTKPLSIRVRNEVDVLIVEDNANTMAKHQRLAIESFATTEQNLQHARGLGFPPDALLLAEQFVCDLRDEHLKTTQRYLALRKEED